MTVASETSSISYTLNGATTDFPVPFYFLANAHLTVWYLPSATTSVPRLLTLASDYTVAGAADESGGTVTLTPVLSDGQLLISRVLPIEQLTEYPPNTPFPASSHERALDYLTMVCQQLAAQIARALTADPSDPDGPFDAHGRRIINLGDAINPTDAVNLETLWTQIQGAVTNGLVVDPKIWRLTPDGTKTQFGIPGADVSGDEWYDVLVNGAMIEPTDGYTVTVAGDPDGSVITFGGAPASGADTWVVLRGYAKPAVDLIQQLLSDEDFINLLKSLVTNTLYETTNVLALGPLKFLIPLYDVTDTAYTADGTKESYLLRSNNAADTTITIRANTGDATLDWETNPIAAPFFSVVQVGDGQVTLAPDTGVTLRVPTGFIAATRGKNSVVSCTADYASGGQWVLSGDLAPAPGSVAMGASPVKAVTSVAGVLTVDFAQASLFTLTLSENITSWTFDNAPPAGNGATYRIQITQNASAAKTVTWPAAFKWPGAAQGSVSTGLSAVDFLTITTFDGGVSYHVQFQKADA